MSQITLIKNVLDDKGEVSRNWSFRNYIGRLASRIQDLEAQGYEFETKDRDGDYVYVLKKKPVPKQLQLI